MHIGGVARFTVGKCNIMNINECPIWHMFYWFMLELTWTYIHITLYIKSTVSWSHCHILRGLGSLHLQEDAVISRLFLSLPFAYPVWPEIPHPLPPMSTGYKNILLSIPMSKFKWELCILWPKGWLSHVTN